VLIGPQEGATQEGRPGPGMLTPAFATRRRVTLAAILALTTSAALALAGAAFVAVRFFKLDLWLVFVGGVAVWEVLLLAGLT
jgi:hypothetical protein